MAAANDIGADSVKEVRVTIGPTQAAMLRNHAPTNALEAKFSMEFAAASALVARNVGLREMTDEFVRQAPVQRTMAKVRTQTVDTRCPVEPVFAFADRVVLELANGKTLDSGDIRFARGNAKLPLRAEDMKAKFFDCVARRGDVDANRLFDACLPSLDNVRQLRTAP
jgi:2-methylcitrate dehydratase PrpD